MTDHRVALVTGAYKGLGFETAKMLSEKGFRVFITARKKQEGEAAAQKLGPSCTFVEMDVTDPASIRKAAATVAGQTDHLDVLINNAGIFPDKVRTLLETPEEVLQQALRTNTFGPVWVIQLFYPLLVKSKSARVINVSSGLGSLEEMDTSAPAYSLSKTALNAVTRQFSMSLAKDKIAVNSVCPGWCKTDMGGPNAPRSPQQGAASIAWLATDASQSVTGKFFRDGKPVKW